jgi:hypothetical protein
VLLCLVTLADVRTGLGVLKLQVALKVVDVQHPGNRGAVFLQDDIFFVEEDALTKAPRLMRALVMGMLVTIGLELALRAVGMHLYDLSTLMTRHEGKYER